jgi:hypothetical protein
LSPGIAKRAAPPAPPCDSSCAKRPPEASACAKAGPPKPWRGPGPRSAYFFGFERLDPDLQRLVLLARLLRHGAHRVELLARDEVAVGEPAVDQPFMAVSASSRAPCATPMAFVMSWEMSSKIRLRVCMEASVL